MSNAGRGRGRWILCALLCALAGKARAFPGTGIARFGVRWCEAEATRRGLTSLSCIASDDADSSLQDPVWGSRGHKGTTGHSVCGVDRRALLAASTALALVRLPHVAAAATPVPPPTWNLGAGVEMPTLALNTVGLSVDDTERAVKRAMAAGIRHVDFHPGKERDGVARVLASSGRSSLFLTTKIRKAAPGTPSTDAAAIAEAQIEEDLRALGVASVDMLLLRDSPDCATIQAQWGVLEAALAAGKCRSIGVINFCQSALECVIRSAKVKPAVNYYMLHVGMGPDAHGLRSFGEKMGVRTFACEDSHDDALPASCMPCEIQRRADTCVFTVFDLT